MTESDLSKKFAKIIRDRGGWARKIAGGPASAGLPDIVSCYRGYGIWIETKLPGKERTLTTLQRATLDAIKSAGGVAVMLTNVQQLNSLLDKIDRVKDA